jgi:hypothetical protein
MKNVPIIRLSQLSHLHDRAVAGRECNDLVTTMMIGASTQSNSGAVAHRRAMARARKAVVGK